MTAASNCGWLTILRGPGLEPESTRTVEIGFSMFQVIAETNPNELDRI